MLAGAVADLAGGPSLRHLSVGDLDADGRADLAFNHVTDGGPMGEELVSTLSLLMNRSGRFEHALDVRIPRASQFAELADLDADGRADLIHETRTQLGTLANRCDVEPSSR